MTTAISHFANARKLNAQAAATLSPEQRREATLGSLADIQRRMSRYCTVRRDGTVQIDRAALRVVWAEMLATASALPGRMATMSDADLSQAVEQVAMTAAGINGELKGVR